MIREQDKKERRLDLLERFVDSVDIRPLFEKFMITERQPKRREKDKRVEE